MPFTFDPQHEQFQVEHYNIRERWRDFSGDVRESFRGEILRIGDPAPLFQLPTIDGQIVDLAELLKVGHVALIFGCYSVPPRPVEMPKLEELHRSLKGPLCRMIFVYTREIHPDEPLPPFSRSLSAHATMEQKIEHARLMRDDCDLTMTICVDDLVGTTHKAYGTLPFSQVIVHRDGTIVHRAEWADADLLSACFANLRRADQGQAVPLHDDFGYSETKWFRR